jgi:hypothetical protein
MTALSQATIRNDYPAITILADAVRDKADDSVPEAVRAWREVGRLRHEVELLRRWKEEATTVLDEWKNGVADVVEPLGYDRHAASGPADLLPGLTDLRNHDMEMTRRLAECVEARSYLYEQVVELTERLERHPVTTGARVVLLDPGPLSTTSHRFISDHATHDAARTAARQIAQAEALAPDGNDRRPCTCGEPWLDGTIHRTEGQCMDVSKVFPP